MKIRRKGDGIAHELKYEVECPITLVVRSPRGDRVYEIKNLVLNAGFDFWLSTTLGTSFSWVHIGTSNAAVASTQTALGNRIASSSTVQSAWAHSYTAGPPDYVEYAQTFRFAEGALNSAVSGNFAEIGLANASTSGLMTRALITNSGGTPTAIAVLADEQLDVIYRVRFYPIQSDVTGSVTLNGVSYNYVLRPAYLSSASYWAANVMGGGSSFGWSSDAGLAIVDTALVGGFTGVIGARTSGPIGAISNGGGPNGGGCQPVGSYVNGSFSRTRRITLGLNAGNGNIKTVLFGLMGIPNSSRCFTHQIEFSSAVPKLSTQKLTLDFTVTLANRP